MIENGKKYIRLRGGLGSLPHTNKFASRRLSHQNVFHSYNFFHRNLSIQSESVTFWDWSDRNTQSVAKLPTGGSDLSRDLTIPEA